jgi:hypothetical protein
LKNEWGRIDQSGLLVLLEQRHHKNQGSRFRIEFAGMLPNERILELPGLADQCRQVLTMNAEVRTRLQRKHNGAADYASIFLIARDGSRERTMRFFPVDVYRSMVEKLSLEKYQGDWCQDLKDEVNQDSPLKLVLSQLN